MAFKEPIKVFNGVSLAADAVSPAINSADRQHATMTVVVRGGGSPVGVLSIQGTCDENPTASSVWKDIGSTVAVNADGDYRVPVSSFGDYCIRAKYLRTSGTGSITGYLYAK